MKYYLYNIISKYVCIFENLELFLLEISKQNYIYKNKYRNRYIDSLSMNFKDKKIYRNYETNCIEEISLRQYIFYDENLRIVDIRNYEYIIFNENYIKSLHDKYYINIKKHKFYKHYVFRKTPIPSLHKHKIKNKKCPKIINELKNSQEEYKYIRIKRYCKLKDLNVYNNKYRRTNKSWKQNKIRYQWQKRK